jgi:hypothetical protein
MTSDGGVAKRQSNCPYSRAAHLINTTRMKPSSDRRKGLLLLRQYRSSDRAYRSMLLLRQQASLRPRVSSSSGDMVGPSNKLSRISSRYVNLMTTIRAMQSAMTMTFSMIILTW